MKRFVILLVAIVAALSPLAAQNYMVVDSEKVFKSIPEYTAALTELDKLSKNYQTQVDAKFNDVERLYNSYMAQRNSLTAADRNARESQILKQEEEANEFQESIFSTEGILMQRRIELISPIQKKVFGAIESYAQENGFDLVLDLASNATILYKSYSIDRTESVINALKSAN
ncbi:MAG: OmpH family outer membrane protein [Rikenellaceae bacterium]